MPSNSPKRASWHSQDDPDRPPTIATPHTRPENGSPATHPRRRARAGEPIPPIGLRFAAVLGSRHPSVPLRIPDRAERSPADLHVLGRLTVLIDNGRSSILVGKDPDAGRGNSRGGPSDSLINASSSSSRSLFRQAVCSSSCDVRPRSMRPVVSRGPGAIAATARLIFCGWRRDDGARRSKARRHRTCPVRQGANGDARHTIKLVMRGRPAAFPLSARRAISAGGQSGSFRGLFGWPSERVDHPLRVLGNRRVVRPALGGGPLFGDFRQLLELLASTIRVSLAPARRMKKSSARHARAPACGPFTRAESTCPSRAHHRSTWSPARPPYRSARARAAAW